MSETNRLKIVSNKIRVKQKFIRFLSDNNNLNEGIDWIVHWIAKHRVIVSKNLDEYENGHYNPKRAILVYLIKLAGFLTALRYLISSYFNDKWVTALMSDANYILAHPRILSVIISMGAFTILAIDLVILTQEYKSTLKCMTLLSDYKHKRIPQLNGENARRLAIKINLISKYLVEQSFWPNVLFVSSLVIGATVIEYLNPNSGFTLYSILFWAVATIGFFIEIFGQSSAGIAFNIFITFYLRIKFKEIGDNIKKSIDFKDKSFLMKSIEEHNSIGKQTAQLNQFYGPLILVNFFFVTPPLMLIVYLLPEKRTILLTRIALIVVLLLELLSTFSINFYSSLISHSAKNPVKYLYKYLIKTKLTVNQRLKIAAFIEKLNGPDIGFYCLDLFPMNNYMFYEYLASCASTYFLILELIRDYQY